MYVVSRIARIVRGDLLCESESHMVGILNIQAASSDKESRARLQAANGRNITLLVKREKDNVLRT